MNLLVCLIWSCLWCKFPIKPVQMHSRTDCFGTWHVWRGILDILLLFWWGLPAQIFSLVLKLWTDGSVTIRVLIKFVIRYDPINQQILCLRLPMNVLTWSIWYDLIVLAFLKCAFWAMIRFEVFLCHGHYTIGRYAYVTKYLLIIWCLLPVIIK